MSPYKITLLLFGALALFSCKTTAAPSANDNTSEAQDIVLAETSPPVIAKKTKAERKLGANELKERDLLLQEDADMALIFKKKQKQKQIIAQQLRDTAKKIIGTWRLFDLSKVPIPYRRSRENASVTDFTFTSTDLTIKQIRKNSPPFKSTYVVKRLEKDMLIIALTNRNRTSEKKIRLTKNGISLVRPNGTETPLQKVTPPKASVDNGEPAIPSKNESGKTK